MLPEIIAADEQIKINIGCRAARTRALLSVSDAFAGIRDSERIGQNEPLLMRALFAGTSASVFFEPPAAADGSDGGGKNLSGCMAGGFSMTLWLRLPAFRSQRQQQAGGFPACHGCLFGELTADAVSYHVSAGTGRHSA